MRHRVHGRKFGREADHRKAMLRNLVKSMVQHERITTTVSKAKEARSLVERVITYGKNDTVHYRRLAFKVLQDRSLVKKLFDELAPRFTNREGGYTRVIKNGYRRGDCAPIAILEFVEGVVEGKKAAISSTDLAAGTTAAVKTASKSKAETLEEQA